jgi:hypothetical protein
MLINLRNALMAGKRLPYDAEVEFLQSTGTQYILTGVTGGAARWEIGAKADSTTTQVLAAMNWEANGGYYFGVLSGVWGFGGSGNNTTISGTTYADIDATIVGTGKSTATVNEQSCSRTKLDTFQANEWTLFASGPTSFPFYGRIYYARCYQNGVLVRDFIPVRKGTTGYLYDRVSGKLFGNAGTGDFVVGPDVVPVEYIESHGTEYIDTGVLIEMTDKVDCTFELLAYGNVTLAGARVDSSTSSWAIWAYTNSERRIRFDLLSDSHGGVVTSIAPTLGQEYKVSKIGERNFVDGVEVQSNSSVAYTPVRTCYLFAMNNGGTASFIGNCRIKDFSIGSKLKYRPVRVGTEGAMMDVLTRRIYRNAGTGAFGYGNDLKYPIPAE